MKRFNYKAKDKKTGKVLKGSIQAENEQTAGKLLGEQGYIPLSVTEEGAGLFGKKGRVTTKDHSCRCWPSNRYQSPHSRRTDSK